KQRRKDGGSNVLQLPSRLAGTVFGWRAGCGHAASRRTLSMHRAWPYRASIGVRRPTVSTASCSNASFLDGCAASVTTARWLRSPQSRAKMRSARHDPIGVAISHVPEGQRLGARQPRLDTKRLVFIDETS